MFLKAAAKATSRKFILAFPVVYVVIFVIKTASDMQIAGLILTCLTFGSGTLLAI